MDRSIEDPPNVGDVAGQVVSDVVDAAHDIRALSGAPHTLSDGRDVDAN
jgi:hypothetical protein